MLQVLPISFGGLGVREGVLVLFLHPFGVSNGAGDRGRAALVRCTLIVSMLGAPAFAVGQRKQTPTAAPIATEHA